MVRHRYILPIQGVCSSRLGLLRRGDALVRVFRFTDLSLSDLLAVRAVEGDEEDDGLISPTFLPLVGVFLVLGGLEMNMRVRTTYCLL